MMFGNYLFNLSPGVLIKTLSHIWGKLNLPTLLFRVGLLTLINIYLPYICHRHRKGIKKETKRVGALGMLLMSESNVCEMVL